MLAKKAIIGLILTAGVLLASIAAIPAGAQAPATTQVGLTRTGSGTFSLDVEGATRYDRGVIGLLAPQIDPPHHGSSLEVAEQ